jgi:hypothetical protein
MAHCCAAEGCRATDWVSFLLIVGKMSTGKGGEAVLCTDDDASLDRSLVSSPGGHLYVDIKSCKDQYMSSKIVRTESFLHSNLYICILRRVPNKSWPKSGKVVAEQSCRRSNVSVGKIVRKS